MHKSLLHLTSADYIFKGVHSVWGPRWHSGYGAVLQIWRSLVRFQIVIWNFHWHNPSDHTTALGSTQPLSEMSTRRIPGVKRVRCVRLTTLPPPCTIVMKSGNLNFLEHSGPPQACNGTAYTRFTDSVSCLKDGRAGKNLLKLLSCSPIYLYNFKSK
jgi:hypothetical protein